MKQEIFLSTGNQDVYNHELDPIKSYLEKRGFIISEIVTHGKDCIRVVLDSNNEQNTDDLIAALRVDVMDILKCNPNKHWLDITDTHKSLHTFSEVSDVTNEQSQKICEAKRILKSLQTPLRDIPLCRTNFYRRRKRYLHNLSSIKKRISS